MKFVRQMLAVFLSLFLASPVWAADTKAESKKDGDYHFFKLGVRPIDPSGDVDWDKECVVTLTDHSPKVRLQYKKADGSIGTSNFGNVRKGVEVIVDGKTGYALRLRICGNGIVEPKNWEPVGEELCKEEAPNLKPGDVAPAKPSSPSPAREGPKFGLGLSPNDLGAKKLKFEDQKPAIDSRSKKAEAGVGADGKDKPSTWYYWVGGGTVILAVLAIILSNKGKDDPKTSGGPAPDPPNSAFSFSW